MLVARSETARQQFVIVLIAAAQTCSSSATSCSLSITTCTEDPPGNVVDVNHGPAALTCPTDADGDGDSPDTQECQTPIVIDVQGDGFDYTNQANSVQFDLVGSETGVAERVKYFQAVS